MNSALSRVAISLISGFVASTAVAADLSGLDVAALPGDRVELKLQFDSPVVAPRGYTIEQPARIALDLPGVTNKLGVKNRELGIIVADDAFEASRYRHALSFRVAVRQNILPGMANWYRGARPWRAKTATVWGAGSTVATIPYAARTRSRTTRELAR